MSQAEFGAAVVTKAKSFLGVPYVWGGTSPTGMDCSGLVVLSFRPFGVTPPRVTGAQQHYGQKVDGIAKAVPGDLVFFGAPISHHVGIYLGGNQIIHAPKTGDVVKISTIWETPSYVRRVPAPVTTTDRLEAAAGGALFGVPGAVMGGITGKGPIDVVGGAAQAAGGAALGGIDAVGKFAASLGEQRTWVRVLQVVGGAGLVIGGAAILGHGLIGQVVTDVIPAGKAVKAVAAAAS